jgi:hypothetical protein
MDGLITAHRDLEAVSTSDVTTPISPHTGVVRTGYTKKQRAAWDRRRSDLSDLAGVADELADVDRQVAEINQRIDQLLAMATTP